MHLIDPRTQSLPSPPPPSGDFSGRLDGVIIPVWRGDLYLAKACCASVRASMGNIPITLWVDGPETDTRELEKLPEVRRMVVQEVADPESVRLCSGTPWTKILLFWLSPYERFLCLDADLLVWGDLRAYADFDHYDFITTLHNGVSFESEEEVSRSSFDVAMLKKLDPHLDWRGKGAPNTGVFFARRGLFDRESLLDLRKLNCWPCYEAGVFHYYYWRGLRDGQPRTIAHKVQLFPAEPSCLPEDRFLCPENPSPRVIHWITQKPKLGRNFKASDDFRRLFLKMAGHHFLPGLGIWMEDVSVWLDRQKRSLKKRFK